MEHIITTFLDIFFICLLVYLIKIKKQNFDIAMEELIQSRAIIDKLKKKLILEKSINNFPRVTNIPPPPPKDRIIREGGIIEPPKTSSIYDKKFPSKTDNANPPKSCLEEEADRRIKELIKNQEEQSEEIRKFKEAYIKNTKTEYPQTQERPRVYVDTNQLEQKM